MFQVVESIAMSEIHMLNSFCVSQVVYWDVLEQKYASEVSQQQEVFGGEQAEQRKKDFK